MSYSLGTMIINLRKASLFRDIKLLGEMVKSNKLKNSNIKHIYINNKESVLNNNVQ